jgi:ATP-dependent helicase HrpA
MLRDRYQLAQRIQRLNQARRDSSEIAVQQAQLSEWIERSAAMRDMRLNRVPKPELDQELPIFARRAEIEQAIRDHQVVVISGATGSGKSTQLPLIALQAGLGVDGMIGHTQPRRIAARSVASRIAQQMAGTVGNEVGFKIRFSDQTSDQTFIKVMTDGILLAEIQTDRYLEQYELIIIDEAHERSLNIDYLLGYLKKILRQRSNLKLIVTSATIDTQRFVEHFSTDTDQVPTIEVEGRTYPVEIRYQPLPGGESGEAESGEQNDRDIEDHLIATVRDLAAQDSGDMLVFLPTENDIRAVHKKLRSEPLPRVATEILPLYARLSNTQQNEIFVPGPRRRIVLATNVAESSITVPRIRFVVDSGTARISYYAPRSKVQRLPIQAISQASADQRAGRCGRIGPGVCVRLYSAADYESRPRFTTPEIRRTNLASVILQTMALKLGSIDDFPFLDPPRPEAIREGYRTLFELGAVDEQRRLTKTGRQLARLPVDPRVGRMLFAADEENCLSEVLIIAAGLELQDPRIRPAEKKAAADQAHARFRHEHSDFFTLLNVWDSFHQLKADLSKSKLKVACERNFLSYSLMIQWQDIHRQLAQLVSELGLKPRKRQNDYAPIHRSLLAGLLSGIGMVTDRHEYMGPGGLDFFIWPGSSLFKAKPQWIMAGEIVETTRRYGRMIAAIDPEWIEPLAKHLVKKRYSEPHWSKKKQCVQALEHVALWGLPIVNGRPVNYGRLDPEAARAIFIQEALGNDGLAAEPEFLVHNRQLIEEINVEMTKTRRRDLIIDSYRIETLYDRRLPEAVFDKVSLLQALKKSPELNQKLSLTREDLLGKDATPDVVDQFPDQVKVGSMQIPLSYRFAPGEIDDGATIKLPLLGVGQLDEIQAGWLVPGLVESRILSLIRSLPKPLRRILVPAPETAARVASEIEFGKGSFYEVVAAGLGRICGERISVSDFDLSKLESHLKVNLQVHNDEGEVIAQGRSVAEIREQLGVGLVPMTNFVEVDDAQWHQDGLSDWTWADLPLKVAVQRGSMVLDAFPIIVDQKTSVGIRLANSLTAATSQNVAGLVRLFQLANQKSVKSQLKWFPDLDRMLIPFGRDHSVADLKSQLSDLLVRIAFVEREKAPRNRADFDRLQSNAVERISLATQEVAKWFPKLSAALHQVQLGMAEMGKSRQTMKEDLTGQLAKLFTDSFMLEMPWSWLSHYPRFLEGIKYRLDRANSTDVRKDQESIALVTRYWNAYEQLALHHAKQGVIDPELVNLRWMIEEFRVSLFAQPLGTSVKVSSNRLDKQIANVSACV